MISPELSSIQHRSSESVRLNAAMTEFERRGGRVEVVAGFRPEPAPPRKHWIDPDTVLDRRRRQLSHSERLILRRIAEGL